MLIILYKIILLCYCSQVLGGDYVISLLVLLTYFPVYICVFWYNLHILKKRININHMSPSNYNIIGYSFEGTKSIFFFTVISFLVNRNSSVHSIPAFGDGSWSASENNVFVINLCLFEQVLFFLFWKKGGINTIFQVFWKNIHR